ncbi:hypothetical protein EYF80_058744 [Liparis tanakae]|uniref:Uncharacterized protein n=1 Tax=Liparis tanakae TaxID=230148 RepID=A0A4Z2EQB7_9TELE|nr:hypothetical protein EYF80_058744 [Liparis tanakae]
MFAPVLHRVALGALLDKRLLPLGHVSHGQLGGQQDGSQGVNSACAAPSCGGRLKVTLPARCDTGALPPDPITSPQIATCSSG